MNKIESNILDISHNYYKYFMSLENVNGIGLGFKKINGINTKELCIHALVEKKISKQYLPKNCIVPKTYMGIKTDVIERGKVIAHTGVNEDFKIRPLQGGSAISIEYFNFGKHNVSTGTLGCIVTKKKKSFGRDYFILSNNHVIADANNAPIGTPIIQPQYKTGNEETVAYLSDFIKIDFAGFFYEPVNYVDVAIARVTKKSLISNKIFGIGVIKGSSNADLGLKVKKVGMKTGLTEGEITTIGVTEEQLFENRTKRAIFKDIIVSDIYSRSGDSGSCVLNKNNEIIGILTGGNQTSTSINDINIVLEKLHIDIYTG